MAPTHAPVSRLWKNLNELETLVNGTLQKPTQYRYDHDLITYQIRQKIAFIRKLLILESGSSSLTKPECIQEIAGRLSIIENDFVHWATSQASDEQQYEGAGAYSMFVADVEDMVSRVTEEKFREGLEVILSKVNLEEIDEYEEKQTYSREELSDEFKTAFPKAKLEKVVGRIGNQEQDQEKAGKEHGHEDAETCSEEKNIVEELERNLPNASTLENIDWSVKGHEEDQEKDEQEHELEVKEWCWEENIDSYMEGQEEDKGKVGKGHELEGKESTYCEEEAEVEYEVIVSKGNLEKIDQEKDEEKVKEEDQHDEKETCDEDGVKEELMPKLSMSDLEKIVSELIEKVNTKKKRGGSWFRRLGVVGAAAIATVGLAIAVFGPVEELGYLVPT